MHMKSVLIQKAPFPSMILLWRLLMKKCTTQFTSVILVNYYYCIKQCRDAVYKKKYQTELSKQEKLYITCI